MALPGQAMDKLCPGHQLLQSPEFWYINTIVSPAIILVGSMPASHQWLGMLLVTATAEISVQSHLGVHDRTLCLGGLMRSENDAFSSGQAIGRNKKSLYSSKVWLKKTLLVIGLYNYSIIFFRLPLTVKHILVSLVLESVTEHCQMSIHRCPSFFGFRRND